eukprot:gnl/TRDRNA2_/TRDRNA2_84445_c0_seq4.p1 gnl/TRDRNA2_/TRDRNA2_84445_c0~~gnl/TRDRNA2_/TRDRNA2_84445_c0_seq4.p1  ORF type:complete len:356 (+),score=113.16 gnl/TRDRNA2_/TRDRNA2_84445_c0_seq4:76-1143(+)
MRASATILILFGMCPVVPAMVGKVSHAGGVAFEVDENGNARHLEEEKSASLAKDAASQKVAMEVNAAGNADSTKVVGDIGTPRLNLEQPMQPTMEDVEIAIASEGFQVESQAQQSARLSAYRMPEQPSPLAKQVDVVPPTPITKAENLGFSEFGLVQKAIEEASAGGTQWAKDVQTANFKVKAAGGESVHEAAATKEKEQLAKLAEVTAAEKAAAAAARATDAQDSSTAKVGALAATPQDEDQVVEKVTAELDAAEAALKAAPNTKEAALAAEAVRATAPKEAWVRDEPQGKHNHASFAARCVEGVSMVARDVSNGVGRKAVHDANRAAAEANQQAVNLVWSHVSKFFAQQRSRI